MAGELGFLDPVVRACAVVAVVATIGAGTSALVVQRGEGPAQGAGPQPSASPGVPSPSDPFVTPRGGFDYQSWIQQQDDAAGVGYRLPAGWRVDSPATTTEASDVNGAVVARGRLGAHYYGNNCTSGGTPFPGAWTALSETTGTDPERVADDLAVAWASSINYVEQGGTVAPVSDPASGAVTLANDDDAVRSWVSVDLSDLEGECRSDRAEVAVTTVARGDRLVSLVQGRYLVDAGGLSDALWTAIAASLTVE